MNLWFSCLLLVAGLFSSSSALTDEECKAAVKPLPEFKPMYGRWTWIMGFSNNALYNAFFQDTNSQWIDFIHSETETPNQMHEDVGIRHPTYCKYYSTVINIVGNSGISQKSNFTCTFHSLPTCKNCLLYHVTAINNNNLMAPKGTPTVKEELPGYQTFYLMSTQPYIEAKYLAEAKEQARCLGFTGEPTFLYDYKKPENRLCDKQRGD